MAQRLNTLMLADLTHTQRIKLKELKTFVIKHKGVFTRYAQGQKQKQVFKIIRDAMFLENNRTKKETMDAIMSTMSFYSYVYQKIIVPTRIEKKQTATETKEAGVETKLETTQEEYTPVAIDQNPTQIKWLPVFVLCLSITVIILLIILL